jgi:hypothetical protein
MEEIIKAVLDGRASETAVERFLTLPADQQEQLFNRLGASKSENAAQFLALLYPSVTGKKLQKLLKKSLFRLKTQGIHVEEPREAGESALKKAEVTREARAFISNYDPEQTRVVLVAVALKKSQFLFCHAVTHFSEGLIQMRNFPVPAKEMDALFEEYLAHVEPPMVLPAVSAPYAGYVIQEAASGSREDTEEAKSLNFFLAPARGDVRRREDIYTLPVDPPVAAASRETVFADRMFETFKLTWTGMEEDSKKLQEAANPGIVLPPHVAQERIDAALKEMIKGEKIGANLPRFKRMLEDYAYLFYCLKEWPLYKGLIEQLKDEESTTQAFLFFVRNALSALQQKKQEEREPGLLVDPFASPRR